MNNYNRGHNSDYNDKGDPIMGKSKRIRSDRARLVIDSPENKSTKSAKKTTVAIVSVLLATVILLAAFAIFVQSGTLDRMTIVAENKSGNKITAIMANYFYHETANYYSSIYGSLELVSTATIQTQARNTIMQILALCEKATEEGMTLDEKDNKRIDDALEQLRESLKIVEDGKVIKEYKLTEVYGRGINYDDVKAIMRMQVLAEKYGKKYSKELDDLYMGKDNSAYIEEHKSDLMKGAYVAANTNDAALREKLKAAKSSEEFRKIYTEAFVTAAFEAKKEELAAIEEYIPAIIGVLNDRLYSYRVKNSEGKDITLPELTDAEKEENKDATVSAAMIKAAYEADGENIANEEALKAAATFANKEYTLIKERVTIKTAYAYPTEDDIKKDTYGKLPELIVEKPEKATDPEKKEEGDPAEQKDPAPEEATEPKENKISAFDEWFFNTERKANDVFEGYENEIYMVVIAANSNENTVDVSHILVRFDTAKDGDEAETKALEKAEELYNGFINGEDKSREAFDELAAKETADSSVSYTNIRRNEMVTAFDSWIFAPERKAGDCEIVKTEYGYHIVYFIKSNEKTYIEIAAAEKLSDDKYDSDLESWMSADAGLITFNEKAFARSLG